jgi:hypothetical protein
LIVSFITRNLVETMKSLRPLVLVLTLFSCQSSIDCGFSLFVSFVSCKLLLKRKIEPSNTQA